MAFKKIGSGWKTKNGTGYSVILDGPVNEDRIYIFFNDEEGKKENYPDIRLGYFEDDEEIPKEPVNLPEEDIPF